MRILWKIDKERSTALAAMAVTRRLFTVCLVLLCVAAFTGWTPKDRKTRSPAAQRDCREALKVATMHNRADELQKLLADDSGCQGSEQSNDKEWTLLHWAAFGRADKTTAILLDNGACIDCQADSGVTALSIAAGRGYLGIVDALLSRGADVNLAESHGWTALHSAVYEKGVIEIIDRLLKHGAKVNPNNGHKSTPLHLAVVTENIKAADLLVQRGADVNARDMYGRTPLLYSIDKNHLEMIQLLLKSGTDPNIKDNEGLDAHATAQRGDERIIELLNQSVR